MISQDWSYYYNKLHSYYSDLEIDGYITEIEMEDYLDEIHQSTIGKLTEECSILGLDNIPFLIPSVAI